MHDKVLGTRSFQRNHIWAQGSVQLISSKDKTVTLFCSKCRQQPIVQQNWGHFLFYVNFPLYYELNNKVTHLLPELLIRFSSTI